MILNVRRGIRDDSPEHKVIASELGHWGDKDYIGADAKTIRRVADRSQKLARGPFSLCGGETRQADKLQTVRI